MNAFAAAFTERIKINAVSREIREGRAFWIKRRRRIARPILAGANGFFRLAGASIQAISDLTTWRRWEVDCFLGLHGPRFHAFAEGRRTVGAEALPGINLTDHLDGGTLTPTMTAAAGRELRRAHAWSAPQSRAPWSHGDPHVGNFIYDAATDEARLIDFEVMHDPAMSPEARHADDALVFLQDMAGRIAAERWLPCAHAFLAAYARPEIEARLVENLIVPVTGCAALWWKVRTSFLPHAELARRFDALRDAQPASACR